MTDKRRITILHVDDNETTRYTVGRILKAEYDVLEAENGAEALRKAQEQPDLIVLDVQLPDINGFEVCKRLKANPATAHIPVLHLSATFMDELSKAQGLEGGADGYLTHPVEPLVLIATIKSLLRIREAERELRESYIMLERNLKGTIKVISETIDMRGPYAPGHHSRVGELAVAIAAEMSLTDFHVQGIELAAAVYDIGLLSLPAEVIQVAELLDDVKMALYQTYPLIGYDLLRKIEFPWPIADIIHQHRECFDGSGFPQGIKGDAILIEARILAIADAIEELTSNKIYRPALAMDKALEVIASNSGSLYDPAVVNACLKIFKAKGYK